MESLAIQSAQGAYPVDFDATVGGLANSLAGGSGRLIVIDRKVADRWRQALAAACAGRPVYEIDATEDEKTLDGCARLLEFFQVNNATRQTRVIAIGGGVVQDIATFCTHVYYRGLKWDYVPTTLLGMADSCIGAKASINFLGFKNQLGVFHAPAAVRICLDFLQSLPETEMRSGYGEIVKLHLAGPRAKFDALARTLRAEGWRNQRLGEFVRASLEVKKAAIETDEFDVGVRRTLNYGHTFGHALESVTNHAIPHGLAVAWGMDLVNYIALRQGLLAESEYTAIHDLLAALFSWKLPRPIDLDALLAATRRDKKVVDGRLTLVLLRQRGTLELSAQEVNASLQRWIGEYVERLSIVSA